MTKYSYAIFLFIFTFAGNVLHAQTEQRISATWQVVKYDITATLPQAETDRSLSASARLELKNVSSRPATSLTLRISPDAEISSIKINDTAMDFTKGVEKVGSAEFQRLAVRIPAVAANGNAVAVVEYKLKVGDNSGISSITPSGSQFLPLSFWYPTPNSWYFARGADFAPFRVRVNAPAGLTPLSAGTEESGAFENKAHGQPFFVAGNWDKVEASGEAVFLPKGIDETGRQRATELAQLIADARAFMTPLLGPLPNVPIRIISVRRGSGYAHGGTLLVDDSVFRRAKLDSFTAMSVSESVAKMWLGDATALTDDGSGIIREGLSRYLATQFLENKFGPEVADVERLRQQAAYGNIAQRDAPLATVLPIDDYYFSAVANKGSMFWRILERRAGRDVFYQKIRENMTSGVMSLAGVRSSFPDQKEFMDQMLDQVTDTNLQVGLPVAGNGEAKVALRNAGSFDVTVKVTASLANGEKMTSPVSIRAKSFGEIIFKTPEKIVKVEIDPEKIYPQTDYSDDVAPRERTDSDPLLATKREFDRQKFAEAEQIARVVLRQYPAFDDVRIMLARSLLAQNKLADAETEFRAVLNSKLPAARSLAWASVGLADIFSRTNRNSEALQYVAQAINADAEYGASLAARNIRNKINASSTVDEALKGFFTRFDQAATANRKADLESMAVAGDATRFASGVAGQVTTWKTTVMHMDRLDPSTALVEVRLDLKLLGREAESGMAVYRMTNTAGGWKLSSVEIFEVR
ncbi:MAG: tetratricopeptide repeat protein [Acidobacteria bacterium]|nr:tetratricopeptide repeat protein [Acidobacteriota bacterium]